MPDNDEPRKMMVSDVDVDFSALDGISPTVVEGPGGLPVVVPKALEDSFNDSSLGGYGGLDDLY
jgi:hypothetical protein